MSDVNMTTKAEQANEIVKNYVIASMGAALVPIPIFDLVALTGIQLKMLHSLARVYHIEYAANLGKSLIASLLSGLVLTRAGATLASLAKTMPGIGTATSIIGVSIIGGASSYAIGKIFIQHFESGGTLLTFDPEQVREHFAKEFECGKQVVTELNSKNGRFSPNSATITPSTTSVERCGAVASVEEISLPVTAPVVAETSVTAVDIPPPVTLFADVETSVTATEVPLPVITPVVVETSVAPVAIPLPVTAPIVVETSVAPVEIPPPVITSSAEAKMETMETSVASVITPIGVSIDSTSPPISGVEESEMTTRPADQFSTVSSPGNETPPSMTIDFLKSDQKLGTLASLIRSAISVTPVAPQTIFSTPSTEAIIPPTAPTAPTATEIPAAVAPATTDSNSNVDQLTTLPPPTAMGETVVVATAAGESDSAPAKEDSAEAKADLATTASLSQLRPKGFWFMK